ncbi:hypothetical protein GCM10027405_25010 [Arthrobacter alkaliphilus]
MILRHEQFDAKGVHGEAVIAGVDEYLRVESTNKGTGALWTSDLNPFESLQGCLKALDASPIDDEGYLVVVKREDGEDVEFKGNGPSTEIYDYVQEHSEQVVYVVLCTDGGKVTWEAPDRRIFSAKRPTAEAGIYQEGLSRASVTNLLGYTATAGLRNHSRAVSRKIKHLADIQTENHAH